MYLASAWFQSANAECFYLKKTYSGKDFGSVNFDSIPTNVGAILEQCLRYTDSMRFNDISPTYQPDVCYNCNGPTVTNLTLTALQFRYN